MSRMRSYALTVLVMVGALGGGRSLGKATAGCGAANPAPVVVDTGVLAACVEGDLEKGLTLPAILQDCGPAAATDIIALIGTLEKAQKAPAFRLELDAGTD
jgi:hypothetical protein